MDTQRQFQHIWHVYNQLPRRPSQAFSAAVSGTPCRACCKEARPAPASSQAALAGSVPACPPPESAPPRSAQRPGPLPQRLLRLAMPDLAQPSLCCALSWGGRLLQLRFACQGLCILPGQPAVMCSTLRHQAAEMTSSDLSSRSALRCTGVAETGTRQALHIGASSVHQRAPAQAFVPVQAL